MRYPFDADAYVVLDIPEPVASKVIAAREKYGDAFRSALPAEITVAGSGGVVPSRQTKIRTGPGPSWQRLSPARNRSARRWAR
jgi:hypothetical protein